MEQHYPFGSIVALLQTDYITPVTRQALEERMSTAGYVPSFFEPHAFETLSIVCDRLMAQDSENRIVNIALFIDQRLEQNKCDGWRYDCLPPDDQLFVKGLSGINETAVLLYQQPFARLTIQQQTDILVALQKGTAPGDVWKEIQSALFFEDLLAEATEIFYSYPLVQEEIRYVGMADNKGWTKIGLNQRDGIEPEALPLKD